MYTRTNQGKRRSVFGSKLHSGWFLCIHGQIKGNDAVYSVVKYTVDGSYVYTDKSRETTQCIRKLVKLHSGWFLCIHGQIKGNDAVYSEVIMSVRVIILVCWQKLQKSHNELYRRSSQQDFKCSEHGFVNGLTLFLFLLATLLYHVQHQCIIISNHTSHYPMYITIFNV